MKGLLLLAVFCAAIVGTRAEESQGFVSVCYFPSWAQYREGAYSFGPNEVDTDYCTHIIWAFLMIGDDGLPKEPEQTEKNQLATLRNMKSERPDLKVLISLGGDTNSKKFPDIVSSQEKMDAFVDKCVMYVETLKLDGIDVDWEFPEEDEKDAFTKLMQTFRTKLDATGETKYLTVALGAAQKHIEKSYDLPEISKVVDLANLMTYDLHGHWDAQAGHQSALFWDHPNNPFFSQKWVVDRYLELGVKAEQATLGVPMYGRVFQLVNSSDASVGAPTTKDPGEPGPVSKAPGQLYYSELCLELKEDGWEEEYDTIAEVPYAYKGDQWVTFDNRRSIQEKVRFIKEKGLAGAMVWEISQDDFNSQCGNGDYPLLSKLAAGLDIIPIDTVTTQGPSTKSNDREDNVDSACHIAVSTALLALLLACWGALWL